MKVDTYGVLIHTYYGAAVGQEDMSYLVDLRDSGFSGNIYEAGNKRDYSWTPCPRSIPAAVWAIYRITSVSVRNPDGSDAVDLRYRSYEIVPGKYDIPAFRLSTEIRRTRTR